MRKPFYRRSRNCWYVKDYLGKFIRLDPDETRAQLMFAAMLERNKIDSVNPSILSIFEAFLEEHQPILSERRFETLKSIATQFCADFGMTTVWNTITPGSVTKWLNEPKLRQKRKDGSQDSIKWSDDRKKDVGTFAKRVFGWAHQQGTISKNPIASLRLTKPRPRSVTVSGQIHRKLVLHCQGEGSKAFALYLIASRCGARPQQIREVTAENVVQLGNVILWKFDDHKTRNKTSRPLVVYLSPCLQTLTKILCSVRPTGPLFCNQEGKQWNKDRVCVKMRKLRKELMLDPKLVAYGYRHGFATDALLAGCDIATVAVMLGHTSPRMVAEVYGHLDQHATHIIDATNRMASKRASG